MSWILLRKKVIAGGYGSDGICDCIVFIQNYRGMGEVYMRSAAIYAERA